MLYLVIRAEVGGKHEKKFNSGFVAGIIAFNNGL